MSVSRWVLAFLLVHSAAAAETGQVLVLYSNSRLGKGNIAFDSGLRQTINANPGQPIQIFSEFLDEPEFGGDRYELTMATYLRDKYAERPLGAVLTLNDTALRFILRYRDRLFPGVPIVYTGATRRLVAFDADAPAGCRRGARRVRLCRHRRAGAEMASACNAFGHRDWRIETGRLGTAGAPRNHSHSGARAGRISDRAHHCRCYRSAFANWEATRWCSRSAFSRTATVVLICCTIPPRLLRRRPPHRCIHLSRH